MIMDFISCAKAGHGGGSGHETRVGTEKGERTDHELRG